MQPIMLLGPDLGAVSGVSTHLNQLIASAEESGHRFSHFQVGSEGRSESVIAKAFRFCASPIQLLVRSLIERPAIMHVNSAMVPNAFWRDALYVVVGRIARAKIVFQVHGGLLPEDFVGAGRLRRSVVSRVLRKSDAVVLLAESERTAYRSFVPGANVHVIPNAIDASSVIDMERPESPSDRPLRLVYIGRYTAAKGLCDIVDAIAILRERGVTVEMVFAGSGSDEAMLLARVRDRGVQDRVRVQGPVFAEAKDRVWLDSDVFVFPTYHCEGLPYSLLESMAAGAVPVVCPVAAIPDVMSDGEHGLFVPPRDPASLADAIERLHRDRALLRKFSRASRERIRSNYTSARLASDFANLYSSL